MSALSLLFGLFFIAIPVLALAAVFLLLYLNRNRIKQKTPITGQWKAVSARITGVSVEETDRSYSGDDDFYYPSIQFEYMDRGRSYTGTQAVGRPYKAISKAWQTLERYPVGQSIIIYYNPEHPGQSRLWVK